MASTWKSKKNLKILGDKEEVANLNLRKRFPNERNLLE